MSDVIAARSPAWGSAANAALKTSAALWFVVAAAGQWLFAFYIAVQYGAVLWGDMRPLGEFMPTGAVAGDFAGNAALIVHLAIAFTITIGGTLQLVPQIRAAFPAFHRWNGRIYVVTAFITSIAALYMVWTRDGIGGLINDISISINAALIMAFAALAWRTALARDFGAHQRWALRLFLVVNGVWFMRLMYGLSIMLAQGKPPGVGENMDGPLDIAIAFSTYLLPLAMLELYFAAKRGSDAGKAAMSGLLLVAAGATALGIFGATMVFWWPRMS
ncbi:MAG: DUF2306 domain-containing protein [Hyphomonadaceae bacterium]|nr:DUF2306 domain-containing protein [Hyphomonadaceae bacterium]